MMDERIEKNLLLRFNEPRDIIQFNSSEERNILISLNKDPPNNLAKDNWIKIWI